VTAKKLFRSKKNKVLGGVCGGIGEYLNIDPTLIRVLFIIAAFFNGLGVLVYIVCWLAIPEEGQSEPLIKEWAKEEHAKRERKDKKARTIIGFFIILVGFLMLLHNTNYLSWDKSWPFILIYIGIAILISRKEEKENV